MRVLGLEQRDLDDGDVQGVVIGTEEDLEGKPDAVVKASRDGFCWDIGRVKEGEYLRG